MSLEPLALEGPPATPQVTAWDMVVAALDEIIDVEVLDAWPTPTDFAGETQIAAVPVLFDPYGDGGPEKRTPVEDLAGALVRAMAVLTGTIDQHAHAVEVLVPPRSRYGPACNAVVIASGYHLVLDGSWIRQQKRYQVSVQAVLRKRVVGPGSW